MADGLKLAQLAGIFAGMADSQATYNPAQKALTSYLQGSAQSAIQAEAQKKAQKKAKKKSGVFGALGTVGSLVAAPFTGGASLAYLPAAAAAGGVVDSAMGGDLTGALNNAVNAGTGAYGAYSAQRTPINMSGGASPTVNSPAKMMDEIPTLGGGFNNAIGGMERGGSPVNGVNLAAKPSTLNQDALKGSAFNRSKVVGLGMMSPRELGEFTRTTPDAEQYITQAIAAGVPFSRAQIRHWSPSVKQAVRQAGYPVPGPFGMVDYGGYY